MPAVPKHRGKQEMGFSPSSVKSTDLLVGESVLNQKWFNRIITGSSSCYSPV